MNLTFSIVTPSFNQGQFIEQTILSVLNQEGDFSIDYIIADGGSTDKSIEIIKKYGQLLASNQFPIKCHGIKYCWWSKKDKGQSDAINQGFSKARGNILAWINSDDYYEPSAFQTVFQNFKNHTEINLLLGDCFCLQENSESRILGKSHQQTFEDALRKGNSIMQPGVFFTKKIFRLVGPLNTDLHYTMDIDLWLRILQIAESLYIPIPLATYRLWLGSKSVAQKNKFWPERRRVYKKYGGRFFDPVFIYHYRYRIPGHRWIQLHLPRLYQWTKSCFYILYDNVYFKHRY